MPSLFIQHGQVNHDAPHWPLSIVHAALSPAIDVFLATQDESVVRSLIKKGFGPNTRSVLEGTPCDLGGTEHQWKLQAREVLGTDFDATRGWIRHTYDLISDDPAREMTFGSVWTSLTWYLNKTPARVHPASKLFEQDVFYLIGEDSYGTSDSVINSSPGIADLINSCNGTIITSLSPELTYFIGSGLQLEDAAFNSRKRRGFDQPVVDIHWIYACISLGRRLPIEPYLLSSSSPFPSSSTLLLPYPGLEEPPQPRANAYWSGPNPTATTFNAHKEIHVALLLDKPEPSSPSIMKGVVMMKYDLCCWTPPFLSAIISLFKKLGGVVVEKERNANYLVGQCTLRGIHAVRSGILNGSATHWLYSVMSGRILPIVDNPIYRPLSEDDQANVQVVLYGLQVVVVLEYYAPDDVVYLRALSIRMGASFSTISEPVDAADVRPNFRFISPYPDRDRDTNDTQIFTTHEWLEESYRLNRRAPISTFRSTEHPPETGEVKAIVRSSQTSQPLSLVLTFKFQAIHEIMDRSRFYDLPY